MIVRPFGIQLLSPFRRLRSFHWMIDSLIMAALYQHCLIDIS